MLYVGLAVCRSQPLHAYEHAHCMPPAPGRSSDGGEEGGGGGGQTCYRVKKKELEGVS